MAAEQLFPNESPKSPEQIAESNFVQRFFEGGLRVRLGEMSEQRLREYAQRARQEHPDWTIWKEGSRFRELTEGKSVIEVK